MAKQTALQAGDFSTKVDVLAWQKTVTGLGEEANQTLGPFKMGVWCKWEDLGGSETPEANRETAFGKAKATFRYNTAKEFTEKHVIRRKDKDYDIENIREIPEPRNMYVEISLKTARLMATNPNLQFSIDASELRALDRRLATVGKVFTKAFVARTLREAMKPALPVLRANIPVGKRKVRSSGMRRTKAGKQKRDGTYDRGGATRRDARIRIVPGKGDESARGLLGISKSSGRVGWRTHFTTLGTNGRKTRKGYNRGSSRANNFLVRTESQTAPGVSSRFGSAASLVVERTVLKG